MKLINKYLILLTLIFFSGVSFGQGLTCSVAEPFCAGGSSLIFENTSGSGNAESGPNYGCLGSTPNPAWYFIQIDEAGDLVFNLVQNSSSDFTGMALDVDFIAYGPFANNNACGQLTAANTVACSFSPAAEENFTIPNAQAGEIYVLLITNFDNQPGYIQLQQTNSGSGGSGATDCSIVNTDNYCEGEIVGLDASTPSAISYEWFKDGTILMETGPILSNVIAPSAVYTANALDNSGVIISAFEYIINFETQPIANLVSDMLQCDGDSDGFFLFNLESQTDQILGMQNPPEFTVTYHLNQLDAIDNVNAITSPFENTLNPQTVYARVENNKLTNCFDTISFNIEVFDAPIANTVLDQEICDDNNDGIWSFDLQNFTGLVLDTQDSNQFTVTYHVTQTDANGNMNALPSPYLNSSSPQAIFIRIENNDNFECFDTSSFNLYVNNSPVVAPLVELFQCDDDTDGFVNFNLSEANELISTSYLSEIFTYHTTILDAENGISEITNPINYTNTDPSAAPDILYVRTQNSDGCYRVSQLNLLVSTTNVPQTFQLFYDVCDDTIIDGEDDNGIATFDFSDAETQIRDLFPVGQALSIAYYENLDDALAETNAILDISNHRNDASPNVQNIFVRIDSDLDNACLGLGHHITLTVNPVPEVIAITDYIVCEDNTDGFYGFDLESKTIEVLNGQDPSIFTVTYHETQADANANITALISPYNNIPNPQSIYVRITNTITGCSKSVVDFSIEVQEEVQANQLMPIFNLCDEFEGNDGFAEFDLLSQNELILDDQDPLDYSVRYYLTQNDADLEINELANMYQNLSNPQIIYARVDDITIANSICWATTEIVLQVNLLPIFNLDDDYLLCLNTNGTEVVELPVIDTALADANYRFEWSLNGSVLSQETTSSLMPVTGGSYRVIVTNKATGCVNSDSTFVNESSPPVVSAIVTSLVFEDSQSIEVSSDGLGVYEYNLDNGAWQDSNIFENVSAGIHIITVRDINGCGISTTSELIIDYPQYFTPNGDGFHDTWNIVGIDTQPDAIIYIFDRFGKLLKQLSPTGDGWDGTFNGIDLPSSDYWFSIEYNEPLNGIRKQFKSHFTLKR